MIEPFLKAQLSRDEGRCLMAYRDLNGHWTIGVGHLIQLDPGRKITIPRISVITDAECDALLVADVEAAVNSIVRVFGMDAPRLIDGPRWRALINMMFNRGEERVRNSTTITPLIRAAIAALGVDLSVAGAKWDDVGDAILASEWGTQIGDRGKRLAKQFKMGVDQ